MADSRARRRDYLTTGDVARVCGVAPRTVNKWCDSGALPCWRVPLSRDRRILRTDLARFCAEHGVPVPPVMTVVGLGLSAPEARSFATALPVAGLSFTAAGSVFQMAEILSRGRPFGVVIDTSHAAVVAPLLASLPGLPVALLGHEDTPPAAGVWCRPFCAEWVAAQIVSTFDRTGTLPAARREAVAS